MTRPRRYRAMTIPSLIVAGLTIAASVAQASMCDMLSSHLDEVESNLQRASRADNLDDGTRYARRANYALDVAALAAMDCDCTMAYMEFETAAGKARRAKNATESEEFFYELRRAIRAYNAGLDALQACD